jgi:hypothetical protein
LAKEAGKKEKRDIRTLARFVALYCRSKHVGDRQILHFEHPAFVGLFEKPIELCPDCTKLLKYGLVMRLRCPLDPKPICKKCPNPCYRPEYRKKVREVMRFSGMQMIKRGRIDLLYHYFR